MTALKELSLLWQNRVGLKADGFGNDSARRAFAVALLHWMVRGAALAGNFDPAARKIRVPDGTALFEIQEQESACWIGVKNRRFSCGIGRPPFASDVKITFRTPYIVLKLARRELDSLAAVGRGDIEVSGLIPLADSLSLVMDRLGGYKEAAGKLNFRQTRRQKTSS